jgi:transcriptional regulator with XRE-family HTH domain
MLEAMYGAFLRRVRESRGMSQGELAAVSGIGQPNISAYENDRRAPSLDTFNRILVSCGYELAAAGGRSVLYAPFPPGSGGFPFDDLPPRSPDDPPDEPPAVGSDASPEQRADAIVQVVALAEGVVQWRSR